MGKTFEHVRVITPDGFGLHCTVSAGGSGSPPLIAMHGGPGGKGADYMFPLHRIAGRRTVVTFDQLGVGQSDTPPVDYEWSLAGAVADLDAIRQHLGATEVDLLGHSWGGILALQFTLDHPEVVRRLVLSNTVASVPRGAASQLRQILEQPPSDAVAAITADALGEHDDPSFGRVVERWLADYGTNHDDVQTEVLLDESVDPGPAGHGLWGTRLWLATGALRGWDVEPRLSEIASPTLVIHGGRDMTGADVAEPMARAIPDCEWITLHCSSHDAFSDSNVDTYLAIVSAFLDGWSDATRPD